VISSLARVGAGMRRDALARVSHSWGSPAVAEGGAGHAPTLGSASGRRCYGARRERASFGCGKVEFRRSPAAAAARTQDQSTETSRRKRRSTKVAQTRSIVGASLEVRGAAGNKRLPVPGALTHTIGVLSTALLDCTGHPEAPQREVRRPRCCARERAAVRASASAVRRYSSPLASRC
jgi:hypothetical protein